MYMHALIQLLIHVSQSIDILYGSYNEPEFRPPCFGDFKIIDQKVILILDLIPLIKLQMYIWTQAYLDIL